MKWLVGPAVLFLAASFAHAGRAEPCADQQAPAEPCPTQDPVSADSARESLVWSTGAHPQTVELTAGTTVVIAPNSQVIRLPMLTVPLGIKDAAPRVFALQLVSGGIEIEISAKRRPIHGVLVHAPRKVDAIIKVGRATILATPSATTVAARAGQDPSVSVAERWRSLRIGRSFAVTAGEPGGTQRPILSAPTLRLEHPVMLVTDSERSRQHLRWQPVAGAQGYRVQLRRFSVPEHPIVLQQRVVEPEIWLEDLAPGQYLADVASMDGIGVESSSSVPVRLRVVEARLPAGAYLIGEAIHLPANERVTLLHAADLEMTYGTGNALFVAVPETVGLHDGRRVQIRLREPGSTLETLLRLEPLDVVARIGIEPIHAQWPGLPLSILVSIRRSNGTVAPNARDFVANVTVNARPVELNWRRGTGSLTAQLEKPPFPGPWVVRVVVEDTRGHVIGRDFLEVAEQPRDETARNSLTQF